MELNSNYAKFMSCNDGVVEKYYLIALLVYNIIVKYRFNLIIVYIKVK